ncbi:winged helix-turn-helix transcriptional regulator [Ligilactobacillus acidipiscis]|uniref:winged helix-turn-helix transcriptional regulator n=1 Tax=Ligilactobacillus acidipiscis TaxID=89059 RepID=UPI0023F76E69|nr:helix-turn-helix domain-containing protein [Ligilactobacillus acidipiscis]WEV58137.1 helix-turn-helix domain-containing protein [Ligilactobacillus acidipiscis]
MTDVVRKDVLRKLKNGSYDCEKEFTLAMFSGKYKVLLLFELAHNGAAHFSQLYAGVPGITKKVLANQLNEMTDDTLIKRHEYRENNRKYVIYSLTETGKSLMPIIDMMYAWGKQRISAYQIPAKFKLDVSKKVE